MKKNVLTLAVVALLAATGCKKISDEASNRTLKVTTTSSELLINTVDISSANQTILDFIKNVDILKNLNEYSEIHYAVDEQIGKNFIYGKAKDAEGNHVVFRIPVVDSDGLIDLRVPGGTIESCTGVNCERCDFAPKGGCICLQVGSINGGPSYCNHSISKPN
ncbi:hypothetical protein JCM31826_21020 [Thermaurantimonas aggregans]|uniref:Uncharacterized protein n=1 Tax=Thermaurantimonas aggregans TaxID=2173829 RepID=A0A401XNP2_9FLAO|nr:hypothetical protein [Thermaurantimonas aggregans]MCX8148016.1 hypothetical protein [Thermaurantimonas aggregans]GCD78620.1 hypothetical protein JCM31826_21020 [Thermaurantimonas aggregans]